MCEVLVAALLSGNNLTGRRQWDFSFLVSCEVKVVSIFDFPQTSVEIQPERSDIEEASRLTTEQEAKYRRNRSTSSAALERMSFSEGTL